jgi:hypothetical protein
MGEAHRQIFAQMHAQGTAATFRKNLEVSPGLRRFDHAGRCASVQVGSGPERSVVLPQTTHFVAGAPIFQVGLYRR